MRRFLFYDGIWRKRLREEISNDSSGVWRKGCKSMELSGNKAMPLSRVKLRDSYLCNAFEKETAYLLSLDTDRLLAGFRETAGVDTRGGKRYPGWENMLIGGHTLGHYITACVRCVESANCTEKNRSAFLDRTEAVITGLEECQRAGGTGFLFGAAILDKNRVEVQFDHIEENKTNIITQAWVPWYTMHKIFEGLVSLANMDAEGVRTGKIKACAFRVADKLADWVYSRVSRWDEATHKTVLGIEYGGMNDCLYDVYLLTGKPQHLEAAHRFDQTELFERVMQGKSGDHVLNNHHANTTIPKFLGALKRYVVLREERYLEYAVCFWNRVTEDHSYITGGNSEWEHFGEDRILDRERTNCNCETCNAYNMQKMTKTLFEITGDVKYADWYERTFWNSVLSSQNPGTGMTTYFQPMASGYYKVYGEPFTKFWCCTGTGMENFSKLQEGVYFEKDGNLLVNQYLSSEVSFRDAKLTQKSRLPKSDRVSFTVTGTLEGNLLLRLPYWLAGAAKVSVNQASYLYKVVKEEYGTENAGTDRECGKGYALIEGPFGDGDRIDVILPMEVQARNLPDGANTYAFQYGPVVLSALLGKSRMENAVTGVDVTIPAERLIESRYVPSGTEKIRVLEGSVEEYMENISRNLILSGEELSFRLLGTDAELTYVPHYSLHGERYGIYFRFVDEDTEAEEKSGITKLDTVQPGYGQYENDAFHEMKEEGTGSVGNTDGGTSRYAKAGGSFSYIMEVDTEGTGLLVTFQKGDAEKGICIKSGETVIYEGVPKEDQGDFFEVMIPLSAEVLHRAGKRFYDCRERRVLRFSFSGMDGEESARVCGFVYTVKL